MVAAAILVLAAGLTACGTGGNGGQNGNGDDNGNGVSDIGILVLSEETTVTMVPTTMAAAVEVSAFGAFLRLETELPAAFFTDPLGGLTGTCVVTPPSDLPGEPIGPPLPIPELPLPLPDDVEFTFLNAGEVVTIAEGPEPYVALGRVELMGFVVYLPETEPSSPLPDDLSATIPGDEFPAVANASFPAAMPFALTAPAYPGMPGAIGPETVIEWTAPMAPGEAVVVLNIVSGDVAGSTFVTCIAADTGSFALPEDTRSELGEAFAGSVASAERLALRVQPVEDAYLVLVVSRGQTFDPTVMLPPPVETDDP